MRSEMGSVLNLNSYLASKVKTEPHFECVNTQYIIPIINVSLARNLYSFNGGMHMKNNATVSFAGNSPW